MANLLFSKEHEWVLQLEDNKVRVGISDYAQDQLGDIVFVELVEEGTEVEKDESLGTVESVKSASEIYSPVSGTVVAVNEDLEDEPEKVNEEPYEGGWLVEIELSNPEELKELLDEDAYKAFIEEGGE